MVSFQRSGSSLDAHGTNLTVRAASDTATTTSPALGSVSGTVSLDGAPLAKAHVLFTPEGPGRTSQAITDSDDRSTLGYLRDIAGANLGPHVVRITTAMDGEAQAASSEQRPGRPERTCGDGAWPAPNLSLQRQLRDAPRSNTIDFALESKPR